jgi:hypothetical protein
MRTQQNAAASTTHLGKAVRYLFLRNGIPPTATTRRRTLGRICEQLGISTPTASPAVHSHRFRHTSVPNWQKRAPAPRP